MVKRIPVEDENSKELNEDQEEQMSSMKSNPELNEKDMESEIDQAAGGRDDAESIAHEISELENKITENYDKYVRAVAELDNFRKRSIKERSELIKYAGESIARDILEVVDGLELACSGPTTGTVEEFVSGVKLILDKFKNILLQHSIKGESAVGERFDPTKHEAVAMQPTSDVPSGNVLEEYRRAYFFKDRLLRPAQVVVATELSKDSESEAKNEEDEKN
jgi:molecular chaperone GrpE